MLSVVFGLLALAAPLFGHHSFSAEYDGSKPVSVTGVLKSVDWRNPHIQLPNEVIFLHEAFRGIRINPTDGRDHPADFDPAYLGSSVGRWEGDTLVVTSVTSTTEHGWVTERRTTRTSFRLPNA